MRRWVVIPAAGIGSRMQGDVPKQYLRLAGRTVLEHSIRVFADHPRVDGIVVAVAPEDSRWSDLRLPSGKNTERVNGGSERCHSVLNALHFLAGTATAHDWVLVHDAARPCLRNKDVNALMDAVVDHPCGGLLGFPVRDTMKRTDSDHNVYATVDRAGLWHAATPQMFRFGMLREALIAALDAGTLVTDESAAMELAGHKPLLVQGSADNIKITRPEDLSLAEFYLAEQHIRQGVDVVALDDGQ